MSHAYQNVSHAYQKVSHDFPYHITWLSRMSCGYQSISHDLPINITWLSLMSCAYQRITRLPYSHHMTFPNVMWCSLFTSHDFPECHVLIITYHMMFPIHVTWLSLMSYDYQYISHDCLFTIGLWEIYWGVVEIISTI